MQRHSFLRRPIHVLGNPCRGCWLIGIISWETSIFAGVNLSASRNFLMMNGFGFLSSLSPSKPRTWKSSSVRRVRC